MLPDLTNLGLDFAIAATFIALVIPGIKNLASLVTVIVAGITATLLKSTGFELWLVCSALLAMAAGYSTARLTTKKEVTP